MAKIFISYRRHDSPYLAATLRDKLEQRFGPKSVFLDVDNSPLGVDFRDHIGNAVGQCDVLLVIIGDEWIGPTDNQGKRRIDDPSDYVRIEIESALQRNIPVIPVLVERATIPSPADLPPTIQSLAFRNAAEIRAGRDLRHHIDQLIHGLEAIIQLNPPDVKAATEEQPSAPKVIATSVEQPSPAGDIATSRRTTTGATKQSSDLELSANFAVRGVVPPKEPPVRQMSFDEFIRLQLQLSTCSASTLPHPDTTSPVQNDHSARLIDELFRDALAKAPKASSTNRLAAHAGASIVSGTREDSGTALSQAPTPAFSPLADSPPSITTACADTQQTSSASGVAPKSRVRTVDAATVSGHRQLARVLIIIFLSIILILILWLASQSTPLFS